MGIPSLLSPLFEEVWGPFNKWLLRKLGYSIKARVTACNPRFQQDDRRYRSLLSNYTYTIVIAAGNILAASATAGSNLVEEGGGFDSCVNARDLLGSCLSELGGKKMEVK